MFPKENSKAQAVRGYSFFPEAEDHARREAKVVLPLAADVRVEEDFHPVVRIDVELRAEQVCASVQVNVYGRADSRSEPKLAP